MSAVAKHTIVTTLLISISSRSAATAAAADAPLWYLRAVPALECHTTPPELSQRLTFGLALAALDANIVGLSQAPRIDAMFGEAGVSGASCASPGSFMGG